MRNTKLFFALSLFFLVAQISYSQTTNYSSIGTDNTDLFNTGTATGTLGSPNITLSNSLPASPCIGQGDQIRINFVNYSILSASGTSIVLQQNFSSASGPYSFAIRRRYNTIQAWENARDGNLVAANSIEVGVCYNDGDFSTATIIQGSTTDATRYMVLTVAPCARHTGIGDTGAQVNGWISGINRAIEIRDNYFRLEWLEYRRIGTIFGSRAVEVEDNATNVLVENIIIFDYDTTGLDLKGIEVEEFATVTIRNSLIYDGDIIGINVQDNTVAIIQNCTIYGMDQVGINIEIDATATIQNSTIYNNVNDGIRILGNAVVTVTNTISMGNGDDDIVDDSGGSATLTQSYNLTSDATATGTGSLINKVTADQFLSITAGSEDLHLKSGADAYNTGTDLSGDFTDDRDGDIRPQLGVWDMGSDERFITYPGNVPANLQLWLQADLGTTGSPTVTAWDDQSLNLNNTTSSGNPQLVANGINYNPAIDFDANGDFFATAATSLIGNNNPYTKIVVLILDNSTNIYNVLGAGPGGNHSMGFAFSPLLSLYHGAPRFTGPAVTVGQPSIIANRYGVGAPDNFARTDGVSTVDNSTYNFTDGGTIQVGNLNSAGSEHDGYISEAIVYDAEVSDADLLKIESYLAIKYGTTLDNTAGGTAGDYQASDATLIWDADDQSAYHNNIIGLGSDDSGGLFQKQSHTFDDSTRIYLSTLAADNASNAGNITGDVAYVLIGDNGGQMNGTTSSNAEKPAAMYSRIEREWKVTKTNLTDDFSWDITVSSDAMPGSIDPNDLRLLVDTDGDFTDATVYAAGGGLAFSYSNPVITVTGISTTQIPDNTTSYITIASANAATPLPIVLVSFAAKTTENGEVQLDWVTASEINNDYFTIEKSENAKDWQSVKIVDGQGFSMKSVSYTAIDKTPYHGISYYRLKQTDLDGQQSYSQIRSVTVDNLVSAQISIFPNPANSQFVIEGTISELAALRLFNLQGQDMRAFIKEVENSGIRKTIDISRLPVGIYVVKTTTTVNKVIKQ